MAYRIERLGLGGILDQAIAITKNHFGLLFTIMLFSIVPYSVFEGAIELFREPELPPDATMEDYIEAQRETSGYWPWLLAMQFVYWALVLPVANAAVIQAVARLYLGQQVTAWEAIRHGLKQLLPLIGTSILMTLIIGVGFMLLIIPGIYFAIWYGLGQHVVVLEDASGMAALRRSKQLVHPLRGTYIGLALMVFAVGFGLGMAAEFVPQPYVRIAGYALAQAVITILSTAAFVVFYFSARCHLENFDLDYLAETIGAQDAAERADEFGPVR